MVQHALRSLLILHGHTRIFDLGLFVDSCTAPSSNFATLTPLCALCKNESGVSLWVWNTQGCFFIIYIIYSVDIYIQYIYISIYIYAAFFEFEWLIVYVAQK